MASVTIKYSYEQVYTSVADKTITVQILAGSDGGGSGVTNHSELVLDDGTNPHGTTKSDLGITEVFQINIGLISVGNQTEWHSGDYRYGYSYYNHVSHYNTDGDTNPIYLIPSLFVAEENIKISRFVFSGYGYTTPTYTMKLIKYNRTSLDNVVTIMNDISFTTTNNLFETYIDVDLNSGLNDVVIDKGEVLVVLWKATENRKIQDCMITVEYTRV